MKEHMSITLEEAVVQRLRRYALGERRPVSQVVEMAIEAFLRQKAPVSHQLVTTHGSFRGVFSREDTYEGR